MYHPTTRALAVLELLQTHRRMSGAELARRLEVDARTLRRSAQEDESARDFDTTARGQIHSSIGVLEQREGGVMLSSREDDLDWYAHQLARLPFDFSERKPRELRDSLRKCATRLQRLARE